MRWRSVVGHEGVYEVSDCGRVRSLDRVNVNSLGYARKLHGQELTPWKTPKGYPMVAISGKHRWVHRLVLEAFVGPCPTGSMARHLNDIKDDNRIENLEWGTPRENQVDRIRNGNNENSNKTHCPKGHPYSGDNLGENKRTGYSAPGRRCLTCHRNREMAAKDRNNAKRRERNAKTKGEQS